MSIFRQMLSASFYTLLSFCTAVTAAGMKKNTSVYTKCERRCCCSYNLREEKNKRASGLARASRPDSRGGLYYVWLTSWISPLFPPPTSADVWSWCHSATTAWTGPAGTSLSPPVSAPLHWTQQSFLPCCDDTSALGFNKIQFLNKNKKKDLQLNYHTLLWIVHWWDKKHLLI